MTGINLFKKHLAEKRAVKVIAGIENFDIENIRNVVVAADKAGASAIDISARKEILDMVKQITQLPVFVSSVSPEDLAQAVVNGADAIELGNFDALYKKGLRISAQEVLKLTKKTLELLQGREVFFSVTVPGHLNVQEQIDLARELEILNIDLIQTEGAATIQTQKTGAQGLLETAQTSIANTIELARNVEIPVMTASGITSTTASLAFAAGASAVGVGSCINKLDNSLAMLAAARGIVEAASKNVVQEVALV